MLSSPSFRFVLALALVLALPACAQQNVPADTTAGAASDPTAALQSRLLLVLPFTNHSSQPSLDWVGESFPEVLNQRLASVGFLPISREDRMYAFDRLGLPTNFEPTRAGMVRMAQALDADFVLFGSYTITPGTSGSAIDSNTRLTATLQILDVKALRLGQPISEQIDLAHLLDLDNLLAWRAARSLSPSLAVAQQTFLAADAGLTAPAFENYIRGLIEPTTDERLRHLREAIRLKPDYSAAWLALGNLYFQQQQWEEAAAAFGHLSTDDPAALRADFFRGLAYFYAGSYLRAEDAFAFVSTRLPLPEVVNNQGVAASRRGKDAAPLFEQATAADPRDADYHFNLAIALRRRGDVSGARRELDQALKLRPSDPDSQAFSSALNSAPSAPTDSKGASAFLPGSSPEQPLERIKRTYAEASFRQAAYEMEQVEAMRRASLPPAQRAEAFNRDGMQFLSRGLLLEAERQFHTALDADPNSAEAHAGIAQVRERSGDSEGARSEATRSLQLRPNVPAYLVLARLDLQTNQLSSAASEVSQALHVDPNDSAARGIRQALEQRGQRVP